MKKRVLALSLTFLLMTSLALVPAARAELAAQEVGGDDTTMMSAASEQVGDAMVHGAVDANGNFQAPPERTQADYDNAVPVPGGVVDAQELVGALTDHLAQADGAAQYVAGYNGGGGTPSAIVSGTLPGSNAQVPAFTYPYAFSQSGIVIPILVNSFGKVFFNNDIYGVSILFYCTGASVTSGPLPSNEDLVITSGHCLHAGNNNSSGWSYNIEFAPNTQYGGQPYGNWDGQWWWVTNSWFSSANIDQNFGFLDTLDGSGTCGFANVADCVGASGLAWNQPSNQAWWAFGYHYPAGTSIYICSASTAKLLAGTDPDPLGIGCDRDGMDGGPWIAAGKVANKGFVNGVYSIKVGGEADAWYSPYFRSTVWGLWDTARCYTGSC